MKINQGPFFPCISILKMTETSFGSIILEIVMKKSWKGTLIPLLALGARNPRYATGLVHWFLWVQSICISIFSIVHYFAKIDSPRTSNLMCLFPYQSYRHTNSGCMRAQCMIMTWNIMFLDCIFQKMRLNASSRPAFFYTLQWMHYWSLGLI